MLKKENRLTKNKEFDNIFNPPTGRKRSSFDKIMGVRVVPNQTERNRFGILISVKVSKKAVVRNKIKRQIREIIKEQMSKMRQGYDCAVICLPGIAEKDYEDIKKSLMGHFGKLGLCQKIVNRRAKIINHGQNQSAKTEYGK